MGANELVVKNELFVEEGFTQKGVALLKQSVAKGSTDIELQMFMHLCGQYKLDPFLKEIYFMKRKVYNPYKQGADKYDEIPTMMVSRDGFLAIAHKSGHFDGMETVALYDKDTGKLKGAKCTVYNNAMTHPITQSVLFEEYAVMKDGKPMALWATKPETMIKKVAEAQALRKAFNIHGVYLQEEMDAEITKDSMGQIENLAETIKDAEAIHSSKENYDEWSQETKTHILDALAECKNEQDVWKVEKVYESDIKNLQEEDRQYILDMIGSARENAINDTLPHESMMKDGAGSEAQGETSGEQPEEKTKVITQNLDHKELAAKEAFGKEWLPKAAAEVQKLTTKAQCEVWKRQNIASIMKLLPEGREYIKTIFTEQVRKLTQ